MFCVQILNFRPHLPMSVHSCTFSSFFVPAFSKYSACIICITYLLCIILYIHIPVLPTLYLGYITKSRLCIIINICIIIRCCFYACFYATYGCLLHSVLTLLASDKYSFIQIKLFIAKSSHDSE